MDQLRGLIILIFPLIVILSLFSSSLLLLVATAIDCGGNQITKTIVVDQSGKGHFTTIQAAIDSIDQNNVQWVKVHINPGTYTEKVEIPSNKSCVFVEGEGKEITTVTYNEHRIEGDWKATFTSYPPNVIVLGITFKNTYNMEGPGVAAAISGDKSVFYECGFIGFQDTLVDQTGRHYFKDCYIQGEVDFICGSGQSYYEDCGVNVTQGKYSGYVTAQDRSSKQDTSGFVFRGGYVTGTTAQAQAGLGRAWGPYSRVIFYETHLSSVVTPQGWDAWCCIGQESKFTYAEVNCTGPGADTSKRVPWVIKSLSSRQLHQFSLSSFINKDAWLSYLPIRF